ncbi:hypothetical protein PINS_up005237 [Pythium insidiosum]|nr:hypothetical protein PINS_up005237 [Pythium insidiosum]
MGPLDKALGTATIALEAASGEVLSAWLVAMMCALMATREANKEQRPTRSRWETLLSQAIRLRVVELSGVLGIRDAVACVADAYDAMRRRETEYALPSMESLFVLQLGV